MESCEYSKGRRKWERRGMKEAGGSALDEGKPFESLRMCSTYQQGPAEDFVMFYSPSFQAHSEARRYGSKRDASANTPDPPKVFFQLESPWK